MLVRRFLFETKIGEWLLTVIERRLGLCVVEADCVRSEPACSRLSTAAQ